MQSDIDRLDITHAIARLQDGMVNFMNHGPLEYPYSGIKGAALERVRELLRTVPSLPAGAAENADIKEEDYCRGRYGGLLVMGPFRDRPEEYPLGKVTPDGEELFVLYQGHIQHIVPRSNGKTDVYHYQDVHRSVERGILQELLQHEGLGEFYAGLNGDKPL